MLKHLYLNWRWTPLTTKLYFFSSNRIKFQMPIKIVQKVWNFLEIDIWYSQKVNNAFSKFVWLFLFLRNIFYKNKLNSLIKYPLQNFHYSQIKWSSIILLLLALLLLCSSQYILNCSSWRIQEMHSFHFILLDFHQTLPLYYREA